MSVFGAQDLGPSQLHEIVAAATAAPSVLNTQPWKFRLSDEGIELHADLSRALAVADPAGRSLTISCGAALFNIRLAVRALGREPVVRLLPRPTHPTHLATVQAAGPAGHDLGLDELFAYIPQRRTNRGPFLAKQVLDEDIAQLAHAAQAEGALLHTLTGREARRVADLVHMSDFVLRDDSPFTAEVAEWIHDDAERADGIPVASLGPRPHDPRSLVRDFASRGAFTGRAVAVFERDPVLLLLSTHRDGPADWLRAGQALQRLLLVATQRGLSASFVNQPLDREDARWMVRDPFGGVSNPQMLMRIGYGTPVPATPRRPVEEVVD